MSDVRLTFRAACLMPSARASSIIWTCKPFSPAPKGAATRLAVGRSRARTGLLANSKEANSPASKPEPMKAPQGNVEDLRSLAGTALSFLFSRSLEIRKARRFEQEATEGTERRQ